MEASKRTRDNLIEGMKQLREAHTSNDQMMQSVKTHHEWKITELFAPDTQKTKWMTLACPCGTFVIVPAVELK